MDISTLYTPILIPAGDASLEEKCAEYGIKERFDNFSEQVEELYEVLHTAQSRNREETHYQAFVTEHFGADLDKAGVWVLYPWLYRAVRVAHKEVFYRLRTARNRYIILEEEQEKFQKGVVGIAGLSVGSSIANILALTNGSERIKIADFDTLALTNLNRLNSSVANLGLNKAVICARRIYELNPFANVEVFNDGITTENIEQFVSGDHPVDVLFDEIDNLKIKIDLRLHAREKKIPVVMVTDNGDNVMIDIERFDQGVTELFHGALSEEEAQTLFAAPAIDPRTMVKMALRIIGAENSTPRMQKSLLEMGRTIPSVPQLGTATTLTGAAGAYIARKIILKEQLFSGRTHLSLDSVLIPDYMSEAAVAERANLTQEFVNTLSKL